MEVPSGIVMLLKSMGVKVDPAVLQAGVDLLEPEKIKAFFADVMQKVSEANETQYRIENKVDALLASFKLDEILETNLDNRIKELPSLSTGDDPKANEG